MEREDNSDQTLYGRMTDTTQSSIAILTDTIMLTSQNRSTKTSSEVPLELPRQRKETISHLTHRATLRQPMTSQSNNVNKLLLHLRQLKLMTTQSSIDDCLKHNARFKPTIKVTTAPSSSFSLFKDFPLYYLLLLFFFILNILL